MNQADEPLPGDDVPELMARFFAESRAKRRAELLSDEPIVCEESGHEWSEGYYGWECKRCNAFYAFGCAPWDEEDEPQELIDEC